MLKPKVAQRPSVTFQRRVSSCSSMATAPIRFRATDGASRHTAYITAAPATTNTTTPTIMESVTHTSAPSNSAGSTAATAHNVRARRRLAATSAGKTWGAPRVGRTWSGSSGGGGARATADRGGPLRVASPTATATGSLHPCPSPGDCSTTLALTLALPVRARPSVRRCCRSGCRRRTALPPPPDERLRLRLRFLLRLRPAPLPPAFPPPPDRLPPPDVEPSS